ncbi:hypothetical protein WA026_017852 [Henosepilachna vigintioctopunctata]|uniref:Transcription factor BTF3 n=1 Tax=Henosepilachna vigintioctopunctata TaxID=420089 RepID=A0AAW1TVK7_9CUCU
MRLHKNYLFSKRVPLQEDFNNDVKRSLFILLKELMTKKLQSSLKKLSVNTIPGIEEVNMIKEDGSVIHFNNPKAQASLAANTFAITGHGENKQITEMLPGILNQLGPEGLNQLKRLASSVASTNVGKISPEDEEDVPDLVENFDEASKAEVAEKEEDVKPKEKKSSRIFGG